MILNRKIWFLLLALSVGAATITVSAQTKRNNRSTRSPKIVQRPPIVVTPNPTLEPQIISTAEDDQRAEDAVIDDGNASSNPDASAGDVQKTNQTSSKDADLAKQIGESNSKIGTIDKQQRNLLELERLTRAEERSDQVHRQLDEAIEKEASLKSRLEQLSVLAQPESIERETAVIGSTKPEEMREGRRRFVEAEKMRVTEQLNKTSENRTRLEAAAANADALVEKLRATVDGAVSPANINNQTIPQTSDKTSTNTVVPDNSPQ